MNTTTLSRVFSGGNSLSLPERLRNTAKTTGLDSIVDLLVEAADALDCQQAKADPNGLFMLDRGTVQDIARRCGIEYKPLGKSYCEQMGLPLNTMGTIEVQFTSFYRFAVLMARHGVESEQKRHADLEEVARKAQAHDEAVRVLNVLVASILKSGGGYFNADEATAEQMERDFVAAMQCAAPFVTSDIDRALIESMLPPLEIVQVPVGGTEGGQA